MMALIKAIISIPLTAIAFTPLWIFLLIKTLSSSNVHLLCGIQIILFITWIIALVIIWKEKD